MARRAVGGPLRWAISGRRTAKRYADRYNDDEMFLLLSTEAIGSPPRECVATHSSASHVSLAGSSCFSARSRHHSLRDGAPGPQHAPFKIKPWDSDPSIRTLGFYPNQGSNPRVRIPRLDFEGPDGPWVGKMLDSRVRVGGRELRLADILSGLPARDLCFFA